MAALESDRRRLDGRTRQPPARRGEHLHFRALRRSRPPRSPALGSRRRRAARFPPDRDSEDHVYCLFEFPGPGYDYTFPVGYRDEVVNYPSREGIPDFSRDPQKRIVVSYSSINGNGYGGYGEVVMGTRGTLVLKTESEVMLYKDGNTQAKAGVSVSRAGQPLLDTTASGDAAPARVRRRGRTRQPRLPRRNRTLGVVHPAERLEPAAALQRARRARRRRPGADRQDRHPQRAAPRTNARFRPLRSAVVRCEFAASPGSCHRRRGEPAVGKRAAGAERRRLIPREA